MRITAFIAAILSSISLFGADIPQAQPVAGTLRNPALLSADSPGVVYGRMGTTTDVTLLTTKPLESVMKGGDEISILHDGNVIHIQPRIAVGVSSISFRVEGVTYQLRVRITTEDVAVPNPVFAFAKQREFQELDRAISSAPVLKPSDVDLTGAIQTIERAATDQPFAATLRNYGVLHLGKTYDWNHCDIHLLDAYQFADLDLIVFKIMWVNQQNQAFYLHKNQYEIFVGDRKIPIIARRQLAPRAIVFPGQQETVWLAVQGYKLRLDSLWNLRLPPDAAALRAFIRN